MEGASYSRRKVGLRGFPSALLSIAEMIDEAKMGAISVNFLLLPFLCPVFISVHCSGAFQDYAQFFF